MSGEVSRNPDSVKRHKAKQSREVFPTVMRELVTANIAPYKSGLKRLLRWMGHLMDGSAVDLRTAFFGRRSKNKFVYAPRGDLVSRFSSEVMANLSQCTVLPNAVIGILLDWEEGNRKGIGPMSMYLRYPDDGPRKVAAVMGDKQYAAQLNREALDGALEEYASIVKSGSLTYIDPEEAIRGLENEPEEGMDTTTNSGHPFWMSGWKPSPDADLSEPKNRERQEVFEWYLGTSYKWLDLYDQAIIPNDELLPYWGTVGQRLVQKGAEPYDPKSKRMIIAMPKHEAIMSKTATSPAQRAMLDFKYGNGVKLMGAWQNTACIDQMCQYMLESAAARGDIVLSGDISNFDATVPPDLMLEVGEVIASWFVNPNRVSNLMRAMVERTGLITPTMVYKPQRGSMRSGSNWTSIIGSACNTVIQLYGKHLGLYDINSLAVLGDDFILEGRGVDSQATATAFSHFNMEANASKQFRESDMLQFLKRTHIRGYPGGIASAYRTFGSTLSFERMQFRAKEWNPYAYIIRAISQLQNATFHPLFQNLVEFMQSGDKYRLGAEMTVKELVTASGVPGPAILAENNRRAWKRQGSVEFEDWSINRVIRGDSLPPPGKDLYNSVYRVEFGQAI